MAWAEKKQGQYCQKCGLAWLDNTCPADILGTYTAKNSKAGMLLAVSALKFRDRVIADEWGMIHSATPVGTAV